MQQGSASPEQLADEQARKTLERMVPASGPERRRVFSALLRAVAVEVVKES